MKKAFSLLELIFAIVVIGVIASFAIPKYLDTRDSAVVSTLKRDISTIITSIQAYHLSNEKIDKITDAITLNSNTWQIEDTKIIDKYNCVSIEIKKDENQNKTLMLNLDENNKQKICEKLKNEGIVSTNYELM